MYMLIMIRHKLKKTKNCKFYLKNVVNMIQKLVITARVQLTILKILAL